MTYTLHYNSPVGRILLAGREDALIGLWLEGQKYFAATLPAETAAREELAAAVAACGNCKIAYGTYTGNGNYGSDHPN